MLSVGLWSACSSDDTLPEIPEPTTPVVPNPPQSEGGEDDPGSSNPSSGTTPDPGTISSEIVRYVDSNNDVAYIPAGFVVSDKVDERTINRGLVVIGPDGSEFVWVPTTKTPMGQRDFGSYFSGGSISYYEDETNLGTYQAMIQSVSKYGGFYMGRFEASYGGGDSQSSYYPASKRVDESHSGRIWTNFSPQDATIACENMYSNNSTVRGFFPWGINWDTTLQWLIDSGDKTRDQVIRDSTSWGNYSNDSFSPNAGGEYTGAWEQAKSNNIYDLAGNNWEWTQERNSSNYVMRGGGYNLMGGSCPGDRYPAALRDPLPGNNHHPNVTFRVALHLR